MSGSQSFTVATGRLVVSRPELVALAEDVGAHRVRSLDGLGLLHVGVDAGPAQAALERRSLGRMHADLLGSEAAWVRQRLARLRLDRPGDRAVLVLRHEGDRLESHLLAAGDGVGCAVTAVFDHPVTVGPLSTVVADELVIEDLDPAALSARIWPSARVASPEGAGPPGSPRSDPVRLPQPLLAGLRDEARASSEAAASRLIGAGLGPGEAAALVADVAAGPLPLVRVVAWWRDGDGDGVRESTSSWMVGLRQVWLVDDHTDPESIEIGPASPAEAAVALAANLKEVLR